MTAGAGPGEVAEAYLSTRNYQRAAEVLESALAEDPNHDGLLAQYARAQLGLKDYDGAAQAAYAALATAPGDQHVMRVYALALNGQGRRQEALQMAWRAATENPHIHSVHYTYASLLLEAGRPRDALDVIDEALRLQPESADSLVLRGDIHRALGSFTAAEDNYEAALRLEPDHASAVHNLAVNRLKWGKLTTSIKGFLGAGRLDPALGELARRNIGVALIRVLRVSTASVILLSIVLIAVTASHENSQSTVVPRVFIALLTLGLVGVIVWLMRSVPRPTLRAVLRERGFLAVRLAFLAFAIIAGMITAVVGVTPLTEVFGPLLLFGAVCLRVYGWLSGE
ncbi:tetratricopeptide repeat protein [Mycolicibacterium fortuitum]|uniref:Tetratricopeptide repeat protein n=2 Tax=Mycolicibacterium fortuitum TaxID=1766 RepID=A0AAE4V9B1_MYCFO|nr:tetratricopeptide repeat protein [Mycolicibacterium fortuitum]MCV7142236.1 tetratricopeptide repeat protein [Mycolicibacterium fortuitum]MDV7191118.1 tetratricopeptide repeat protein [Mycolicibacterium fortuitum]MDV7206771.1 tetratricopeptide repeat protein [Mycolicibacterium fortuitum]MDV7230477.1 tetratricopeptide repeat protein [Mycolicibacterium fortuitum]MDV7258886.1 tetratricopeptide repeat protein [Mycolicibacterium fortuitum]